MALTNEDFNKALQLASGRQAQGFTDIPQAKKAWSWGEAGQDFVEMGDDVIRDTQERLPKITDGLAAFAKGEQGPLETGFQVGGQGLGIGLDLFSNAVMGAGKMILSQGTEAEVSKKTGEILDQTGIANQLREYYDWKQTQSPRIQRDLDSAELVPEVILDRIGLGGIAKTGKLGKNAIKTTVRTGQNIGQKIEEVTPTSVRTLLRKAPEQDRVTAINSLEESLTKSFVSDKPAIQNKLEKLANRSFNEGGRTVTSAQLIRELAEEGVVPQVDGKLAKFDEFFKEVDKKETEIGGAIDKRLSQVPELTDLSSIKKDAIATIKNNPQVGADLNTTLKEINRVFASLENKYGNKITAPDVNEIRKQMNRRTKSFDKEIFVEDASNAIADATRNRIDKLVPTKAVREANAELGRLYRLRDTATIINNKPIDIGVVGSQLGRYLGVVAAAPVGFSTGGAGGLVVAGIAAHYGAEVVAKMLRTMRFGDKNRELIIKAIKRDPYAARKLIDEAEGEDKALLERLLLPAPSGQAPIEAGAKSGGKTVEVSDAPKGLPRQNPKTGRLERTFKSTPEEVDAKVAQFFEAEPKKSLLQRASDAMKDQRGSVQLRGESTSQKLKRQSESSRNLSKINGRGLDRLEEFVDVTAGVKKVDDLPSLKADAQIIADKIGLDTTVGDKALAKQIRAVLDRNIKPR